MSHRIYRARSFKPAASRNILQLATFGLGLFCLSGTGCKEDDGGAFPEDGMWVLQEASADGSVPMAVDGSTENAFIMRFFSSKSVVAVAGCITTDPNAEGGAGPFNSSCRTSTEANWDCHCYEYDFSGEKMDWYPYTPGVGSAPDAEPFAVSAKPQGSNSIVKFTPLPRPLWQSNGSTSVYTMSKKVESVVLGDDLPHKEALNSCLNTCGM